MNHAKLESLGAMDDLGITAWDLLGFALFGIAAYMIIARVIMPRFGGPWISKRRREEAIARAEELLHDDDLDEETRHRLQRCLSTVRSHGSSRESWSGSVPVSDIVKEIDSIWEEQRPSRT